MCLFTVCLVYERCRPHASPASFARHEHTSADPLNLNALPASQPTAAKKILGFVCVLISLILRDLAYLKMVWPFLVALRPPHLAYTGGAGWLKNSAPPLHGCILGLEPGLMLQ